MSKRTFVDLKEIASFNSLYNAWRLCSMGDGKDERRDVIDFGNNLTANLKSLRKRLLDETWVPDTGRNFWLYTEKKWRKIHTVGIEDRIVHQALVYHFSLQRRFINRTFGSIKGRGTLKANKQVRKDLHRSGFEYVIKLDAKKYYPNINKLKLIGLIRWKYKGEAALRLFEKVIMSYQPESEIGVSIGALTSQNNGNFYLTPFDYFVLQILGVKYFSRYVDDMVIICKNKKKAAEWIPKMKEFAAQFGITFGKIEVFPIYARRIDFCGYAVNKDNVRLRKATAMRFVRKLNNFDKRPAINGMYERNSVCSYLGMLKYCDSYNLLKQLKNEHSEVFRRIDRYAKGSRSKDNEIACTSTGNGRIQKVLQSSRSRAGRNSRGQRATRYRGRPMR